MKLRQSLYPSCHLDRGAVRGGSSVVLEAEVRRRLYSTVYSNVMVLQVSESRKTGTEDTQS